VKDWFGTAGHVILSSAVQRVNQISLKSRIKLVMEVALSSGQTRSEPGVIMVPFFLHVRSKEGSAG
jgi:hypothetical protein